MKETNDKVAKALREIIYTAALGKDLSVRHHGSCLPELEEIIEKAKAALAIINPQ